jgi:hypothetical protein
MRRRAKNIYIIIIEDSIYASIFYILLFFWEAINHRKKHTEKIAIGLK